MSAGAKTELHIAAAVAEKLCVDLAPYCERIAIAGSIRRKATLVSDIELVAIPKVITERRELFEGPTPHNLLEEHLVELIRQNRITSEPPSPDLRKAWGGKYKKLWLVVNSKRGMMQVDLFLTTRESWGAILVIRTGPAEFSRALMTHINTNTTCQQRDGALMRAGTAIVIPTPEEKDYFEAVELLYLPPERRTVPDLLRAAAGWGKGSPKRKMAALRATADEVRDSKPNVAPPSLEQSAGETMADSTDRQIPMTIAEDMIPYEIECDNHADVRALIRARLEAEIV